LEVRRANDRRASSLIGTEVDAMSVSCECGGGDCSAQLTVSRNAYRNVRRRTGWFLVLDGHQEPDAHPVIQLDGSFLVVAPGAA
jgi:hypothetical protein